MQQSSKDANTYNTLSLEEQRVILHKGTEMPFSGKYTDCFKNGVYVCKQCNWMRRTDTHQRMKKDIHMKKFFQIFEGE